MKIQSFKLRFHEQHVRVVLDDTTAPGIDLRGNAATDILSAAASLEATLRPHARADGAGQLRAVSVDLQHRRVVATFHHPTGKPIPLRLDTTGWHFVSDTIDRLLPQLEAAARLSRPTCE